MEINPISSNYFEIALSENKCTDTARTVRSRLFHFKLRPNEI